VCGGERERAMKEDRARSVLIYVAQDRTIFGQRCDQVQLPRDGITPTACRPGSKGGLVEEE